jgi:periplasmic divalent cation tolerance protein
MGETVIVFVSCEGQEQAESIASRVVESQLAACVNVLPGVRSCFVWEGKLTWSDEVLLLLKTTRSRFIALETRIRELHSYEVPEIVAVPIEMGSGPYLKWVEDSVRAGGES